MVSRWQIAYSNRKLFESNMSATDLELAACVDQQIVTDRRAANTTLYDLAGRPVGAAGPQEATAGNTREETMMMQGVRGKARGMHVRGAVSRSEPTKSSAPRKHGSYQQGVA